MKFYETIAWYFQIADFIESLEFFFYVENLTVFV